MDLGFGGEVAGFYHQYRRGYPPAVFDTLAGVFSLTSDDIVVDLGCGTGQLTLPLAATVRAVAGVDPEPDMLARARRAAAEQNMTNVAWLLGADTDMPALAALLGGQHAGAVTIGQALHWMDYRELFPALVPLLRPGGGVGLPLARGDPRLLGERTGRGIRPRARAARSARSCAARPSARSPVRPPPGRAPTEQSAA